MLGWQPLNQPPTHPHPPSPRLPHFDHPDSFHSVYLQAWLYVSIKAPNKQRVI